MARISDDEVNQLKTDVSLVHLAESQGYVLKREGADYVLCCPFHEEKTASMKITPDKNLFHCFGCGAGGSVIDWVMKTENLGFKEAVESLQNEPSFAAPALHAPAALEPPCSSVADVKTTTVKKQTLPLSENADSQSALQEVIAFYHETLKNTPEAQEYLQQRGLDDAELIDHFKLGYANRTLGLQLPSKQVKAGEKLRGLLQEIGIYRASGHEHFAGSLVVPVINNDQVLEVYGRKLLGKRLRKGTPQHLYLPGPHEGVFNVDGLVGSEAVLCESLIDALTFWRWGFKSVTCSYGTSGFTDEILQALIDRNVKRVLIAYDRDEAGSTAAEKVAKTLNKNGIDAYRILFPKNMDANEYALKMTPPQRSLGLVIRKAEPMGKVVHEINPSFTAPAPAVLEHPCSLAAEVAVNELEVKATPVASLPTHGIPMEVAEHEIIFTLGDRSYRVKGFDKAVVSDSLKVNLMVMKGEGADVQGSTNIASAWSAGAMHMDKLDLYSSKQRQVFVNQASVELGVEGDVIKRDLGKVLLQLEQLQQAKPDDDAPIAEAISEPERDAALELLGDPSLLSRILIDFENAGVVGEESNKLVGYLACVSRLLQRPLAVMVQSSSAAGKSSLMDAILNLMPEAERVQYSAMTGQSLFYMGETNLKHKILAISEEEGAHNASYALKLLQSEGEVTIASTGKDESTGDLVTKEYRVEGPVMLFMTTTAIDIDEELLNRCLVLSVNESREQTQAIHVAQRQSRTLAGLQNKLKKEQLTTLHRNAQSLLRPLAVINPYADQLTFLDDKTRTRRDHEKYLTLIDSIALLHQYQREIKSIEVDDVNGFTSVAGAGCARATGGYAVEYIEVELSDIETANRLANEVLGKTLDELPPQTRKLLTLIAEMVVQECTAQSLEQVDYRFSRRVVRQLCGWSETQVRVHMQRLVEMEYLLVHRGGRGQSFDYELLYGGEGELGDAFLMGLLDVEQLQSQESVSENKTMMQSSRGSSPKLAGSTRPQRGVVAEGEKTSQPLTSKGYKESSRLSSENTHLGV